MPVTITKAKAAQKSFVASLPQVEVDDTPVTNMEETELADVYGQLGDYLEALAMDPAHARFKEVGAELMSRSKNLEPTESYTFVGNAWVVENQAGKVSNKRTVVNLEKARQFMGDAVFMQVCTILLKDLDKYLTPEQLAQVVETSKSVGPRKLKARKK